MQNTQTQVTPAAEQSAEPTSLANNQQPTQQGMLQGPSQVDPVGQTLPELPDEEYAKIYSKYLDSGRSAEEIDNAFLTNNFGETRLREVKELRRKNQAVINYNNAEPSDKVAADIDYTAGRNIYESFKEERLSGLEQADQVSEIIAGMYRQYPDLGMWTNLSSIFGDEEAQELVTEREKYNSEQIRKTAKEAYNLDLFKDEYGEWNFRDSKGLTHIVDPSFWDHMQAGTAEIVGDVVAGIRGYAIGKSLGQAARTTGSALIGKGPILTAVGGGMVAVSPLLDKIGGTAGGTLGASFGAFYGGMVDQLRFTIENDSEINAENAIAAGLNGAESSALGSAFVGTITTLFPSSLVKKGVNKLDKVRKKIISPQSEQGVTYAKSLGGVELKEDKIVPSRELQIYAKRFNQKNFSDLASQEKAALIGITNRQAESQFDEALPDKPYLETKLKTALTQDHKKYIAKIKEMSGNGADDFKAIQEFTDTVSVMNAEAMDMYSRMTKNVKNAVVEYPGEVPFNPEKILKELKKTADNSRDLADKTALQDILKTYYPKKTKPKGKGKGKAVAPKEIVKHKYNKGSQLLALTKEINSFINNRPPSEVPQYKALKKIVDAEMATLARTVGGEDLYKQVVETNLAYKELAQARQQGIYSKLFNPNTYMSDLKIRDGMSSAKAIKIIGDSYTDHEDTTKLIKLIARKNPKMAQQIEVGLLHKKVTQDYAITDGEFEIYDFASLARDLRTNGKPKFFTPQGKAALEIVDKLAEVTNKDAYMFLKQAAPKGKLGKGPSLSDKALMKMKYNIVGKTYRRITGAIPFLGDDGEKTALVDMIINYLDNPKNLVNYKKMEDMNKIFGLFTEQELIDYAKKWASHGGKGVKAIYKGIDYTQLHRTAPLAMFREVDGEYDIRDLRNDKNSLNFLHKNAFKYVIDDKGKIHIIPKEK